MQHVIIFRLGFTFLRSGGNVVITVEGFSARVSSPVNLANRSLTLARTQAAGNYYNTVIMIISSVIMRKAKDSQGNGCALDTVHIYSSEESAHVVEDLFYWLCCIQP